MYIRHNQSDIRWIVISSNQANINSKKIIATCTCCRSINEELEDDIVMEGDDNNPQDGDALDSCDDMDDINDTAWRLES